MVAAGNDEASPVEGLSVNGGLRKRQPLPAGQQRVAGTQPAGRECRADVGAQGRGEPDRTFDIQFADALLQQVCTGERLCRVLQNCLDERWRQPGVDLQQQRRRAGHHRRSHGRPAQFHQCSIWTLGSPGDIRQLWIGGNESVPAAALAENVCRQRTDDAIAGRHKVRLQ